MTPNIASAIQTKFDAGSGSGRKLSHTNVAPVADPSTDRPSATNAARRGNHLSRKQRADADDDGTHEQHRGDVSVLE